MTGPMKYVAARFPNLEEYKMLNVHCVYHQLAFSCSDSGYDLAFISDYESIMIQLWNFFKDSPK